MRTVPRPLDQSCSSGFPFGSVLKGTDLVITDGNGWNFGQDLLHALFHIKEGIPGFNDNNCQVEEIWARVPALHACHLYIHSERVRVAPY